MRLEGFGMPCCGIDSKNKVRTVGIIRVEWDVLLVQVEVILFNSIPYTVTDLPIIL
jgi:hypothetical protein